jgi:hypothetical protein
MACFHAFARHFRRRSGLLDELIRINYRAEDRNFSMEPATIPPLPSAASRRMRLAYHLAIVLVVKIILLALLWHTFIKPNKVEVDVGAMSKHIAGSASSVSSLPTSPGDNK